MLDQDKIIEQEGELNSGSEVRKTNLEKKRSDDNKEEEKSFKEKPKKSVEDLEKKDAIFEKINRHKEDGLPSEIVQQDNGKNSIKKQAKDISAIDNAEGQVKKLVELAIKKDPFMAIKVARHMDKNYVLDKLHDVLVEEKTRKILLEKGLLKKA